MGITPFQGPPQGFSNLPAHQICWQERLFKLAGEVFPKKSLPVKKKSLPIFEKITTKFSKNHLSSNDFEKKSLLNHCCLITWRKSVVIFFQKFFWVVIFLAQEKNGSDFLALLKKFENPCLFEILKFSFYILWIFFRIKLYFT